MSVGAEFNISPKLAFSFGVIPPLPCGLYPLIVLYAIAKLSKDVLKTGLLL
jgi:hypothetical protein